MENLWPIAVGLSIFGLIWAVVMATKFDAERADKRRMDAIDAALAHAPHANAHNMTKRAHYVLRFLEHGEVAPVDADEKDEVPTADRRESPYPLHAHEAS